MCIEGSAVREIPAEYADGLANALRAAARGQPMGREPAWMAEFREEYAAYKAAAAQPAADAELDTLGPSS